MIALVISVGLAWFTGVYVEHKYGYADELDYFPSSIKTNDNLTIGIIGDSWVYGNKLDSLLMNRLTPSGLNGMVISSGHPGAISRSVYEEMFIDDSEPYSSRSIIETSPDYCVVVCGVNDAVRQIGAPCYAHHMVLIARTLLHYGVKPVIVSLPEYNVAGSLDEMGWVGKYMSIISAQMTSDGSLRNVLDYRSELELGLEAAGLKSEVLLVDYDNVCKSFDDCSGLYANSLHLSTLGNEVLSTEIANEILDDLDLLMALE